MEKLILIAGLLLGQLQVTSYRSVPNQTDDSPYHTSIGQRVHPHGVAVSRDLLKRWGGPLDYGDFIYIEGYGIKVVNDCMAARHKRSIDMWVETYSEEKAIGVRKLKIYKLQKELYVKETKKS